MFLFRLLQDLSSSISLKDMTGFHPLEKKQDSLKDKEPEIFDVVIVRSRQVIEREDGSIDDVSGSTRTELIQTSMTQNLWSSAWRTTRNYYLLSFLLRESASLTDLIKYVEVYKWCWCLYFECFSRCWWKVWSENHCSFTINWIRKIKKRHVIDLEIGFFSKDSGSRKRNLQTFVFLRHSAQTYLMYLI